MKGIYRAKKKPGEAEHWMLGQEIPMWNWRGSGFIYGESPDDTDSRTEEKEKFYENLAPDVVAAISRVYSAC